MDTFIGQGGKARVDFRGHVVARVVFGEDTGSLAPLLERIAPSILSNNGTRLPVSSPNTTRATT